MRPGSLALLLSRRSSIVIIFLLLVFYLLWCGFVGQRILNRDEFPGIIEHQRCLNELATLRLQVSVMRSVLSSLHVEAAQWRLPQLPVIHVVTPTKQAPTQKADLTRLMNTLRHVTNIHWLVVEDGPSRSERVRQLLTASGIMHTHLHVPTPASMKLHDQESRWRKPRGVWQRNAAISWLLNNNNNNNNISGSGVVYFADDDNTYSLELFDEIRHVRRVGVWPVGLVGGVMVERPRVTSGRVTGWLTQWRPQRQFATDMAGFAVNMRLFLARPDVRFSENSQLGYLETDLLTALGVTWNDLEVKADQATKVLVWHTQTRQVELKDERQLIARGLPPTDLHIEV